MDDEQVWLFPLGIESHTQLGLNLESLSNTGRKTVFVPGAETHRIIYEELCRDITTEESAATYVAIAGRLVDAGADCLILGCTEVGMLLNQGNVQVPVFDTTLIHCSTALDKALE